MSKTSGNVLEGWNEDARLAQMRQEAEDLITGKALCKPRRINGTRTKPMKLLVLSMGRTGTVSMFAALTTLGLHPYHYGSMATGYHFPIWSKWLEAKQRGETESWGKKEFDELLWDHDAVLDVPCVIFATELMRAYPEALVVLSERPVDAWVTSMHNTLVHIFSWRSWPLLAPFDRFMHDWWRNTRLIWGTWCGWDFSDDNLRRCYRAHSARVRAAAAAQVNADGARCEILEYELGSGWGPLCAALGKEVPDEEYPRMNDTASIVKGHATIWREVVKRVVKNIAVAGVGGAVVLAAAVYLPERLGWRGPWSRLLRR